MNPRNDNPYRRYRPVRRQIWNDVRQTDIKRVSVDASYAPPKAVKATAPKRRSFFANLSVPDKVNISVRSLVPIAVVIIMLLSGGVFFASKHRARLIEVDQKQIANSSAAIKAHPVNEASPEKSNKFTVLFYYDGYDNPDVAQNYIGLMQSVLRNIEPFSSNADMVQTKVFTSGAKKCHVEKGAKSLLKCDESLISEINKFGYDHFKLVIVSPENFTPNAKVARGKNSAIYLSTYKGVLTEQELRTFLTRFFAHELGHSLGLRDEYARERPEPAIKDDSSASALSSNIAYQPAQPNCAPDEATAKKWWDGYIQDNIGGVGLFHGCAGRNDYVYSEEHTVMSDDPTKETYGRVSEDYLRATLNCFYGGKTDVKYPDGTKVGAYMPQKCEDFTKQFPNFWFE